MELETDFVISRMRELLSERNWTTYRLAKESGLAYSSLNNIFVRNTVPSVYTLEKICNGFHITLSQFFEADTPIKENVDSLLPDEYEIITLYRNLSCTDKKLLNAYISGLAKKLPENE